MLRSSQSMPAGGSEVRAEFLFLYRNHVHKNNSLRSGRLWGSLLQNYLDVLMGVMCCLAWLAGNLELAFCFSRLGEIAVLTEGSAPAEAGDLW